MSNLTADIQASILKAKNYVDALTIKSSCNIPKEVVSDEHKFFHGIMRSVLLLSNHICLTGAITMVL